MNKYNSKKIESKWQDRWAKDKLYQVDLEKAKKPYYNLMMFPYPSAEGLHVGNMYAFVHSDTYGRFMRLKGFDVFEPIGLDGFGIHSENYAIKIKEHIRKVSERTEKHFYEQLHQIGNAYDWSRTVETYKPNYYKWTQWLFLKMYEKGLAYRKKSSVNWCTSCKTVLSDEQVISGKCERCSTETEKKEMEQWFWRITDYAEKLLKNLEKIDWSDDVKLIQKNWIGRSEGAIVEFRLSNSDCRIKVFTTRPDTLFGCTYFVLAPEHPLLQNQKSNIKNQKEVFDYVEKAKKKSEIERTDLAKEKTGVKLEGVMAINPVNNEEIPIFVADYVLIDYGTGAIMAVPAHDERDWEFAKKYSLEIIEVVKGGKDVQKEAYVGDGEAVNSGFLDGLKTKDAIQKIIKWLEDKKLGKKEINYKLRDWCVSRQRYWGPPIPMIYCEQCAKEGGENAIIMHGWEGSAESGFIPALKENLISKGYNAQAFDAPGTEAPVFEKWFKFIESKVKNNTEKGLNLIGHSMGGLLALKLAEKYKVNNLVLVAPVGSKPTDKYFNQFKDEFASKEMQVFKKYQNREIDADKIKKNTKKITILFGLKDPYITKEIREIYTKKFKDIATIHNLKDWGHFSGDEGVTRLELVENLFKEVDKFEAGWRPVPEKDLPVLLPEMDDFLPDGSGKGPLNKVKKFVNTTCPKCGSPAKRETDVSDPFVDSSWYFMRYLCTEFNDKALDKDRLKKWMPVDMYIGGKEHSVLHLLYSRFVTMVLHELGYVPKEEPYKQFRAHGLLISEGAKISKSKGNIINPDEYIEKFGADAVRMYLMFLGDMRQGGDWRDSGMAGMSRFVQRVWKLKEKITNKQAPNHKQYPNSKFQIPNSDVEKLLHKTIKGVGEDLENLKYNTAISKLMILVNKIQEVGCSKDEFSKFTILLAPFAPHLSEELWLKLHTSTAKDGSIVAGGTPAPIGATSGNVAGGTPAPTSVFKQKWPSHDPKLVKDETIELVIQVNGKVRDKTEVKADITEDEAKKLALDSEKLQKWIKDKEVVKVIFVKGRLVNVVVK